MKRTMLIGVSFTLIFSVMSFAQEKAAPAAIDSSAPMQPTRIITAEGSCFAKGQLVAQAALGLIARSNGSVFGGVLGGSVSADYAVHDVVSVGAGLGLTTSRSNNSIGIYKARYDYVEIPIALRGAFHPFNLRPIQEKLQMREKLDAYVGLALGGGFRIASWKDPSGLYTSTKPDPQIVFFLIRPLVGARYYFSPKLYGTFELGGVCGWFNFGVGMKF